MQPTAITDNSKSPTGSGNPLRACGPDQKLTNPQTTNLTRIRLLLTLTPANSQALTLSKPQNPNHIQQHSAAYQKHSGRRRFSPTTPRTSSLSDVQATNDRLIPSHTLPLQVIQQLPATTDLAQKTTTPRVVLWVSLQVLSHSLNLSRQNRNLHLRRTRIARLQCILGQHRHLVLRTNRHLLLSPLFHRPHAGYTSASQYQQARDLERRTAKPASQLQPHTLRLPARRSKYRREQTRRLVPIMPGNAPGINPKPSSRPFRPRHSPEIRAKPPFLQTFRSQNSLVVLVLLKQHMLPITTRHNPGQQIENFFTSQFVQYTLRHNAHFTRTPLLNL